VVHVPLLPQRSDAPVRNRLFAVRAARAVHRLPALLTVRLPLVFIKCRRPQRLLAAAAAEVLGVPGL
jgi:hypothetical protein